MTAKELIQQMLDFYRYKLENDCCTMEELESISKMLQNNLEVIGTIEDFAKYCGKPEQYVRNVINRKVIDKPKRRVYYRFFPFIRNIPDKWLKDK